MNFCAPFDAHEGLDRAQNARVSLPMQRRETRSIRLHPLLFALPNIGQRVACPGVAPVLRRRPSMEKPSAQTVWRIKIATRGLEGDGCLRANRRGIKRFPPSQPR